MCGRCAEQAERAWGHLPCGQESKSGRRPPRLVLIHSTCLPGGTTPPTLTGEDSRRLCLPGGSTTGSNLWPVSAAVGGHRAGVLYLGYGHLMGRSMDEEAEV